MLRSVFFRRAEVVENGRFGLIHRKHRRQRSSHRSAAHHPHEGPPANVALTKDRPHDGAFDSALHHLLGGHLRRIRVRGVMRVGMARRAAVATTISAVAQIGFC